MKYSKNKKSKFFAIVYSLVMMLAILQVGSVVFGGVVIAVDEWNQTTKPVSGISIIENSSSKTTMVVSTPTALDYALYYASNPASTVDLTIELVQSIDMSAKYIKPKTITNSKLTKLTIIGHGNTIFGLKYSSVKDSRIGLISYITRPLLVEGVNFRLFSHTLSTQNNAFGALIGVTECSDITITKCAIYGTITVTNSIYGVGGLIGYTNSAMSSINNCWSYCTIISSKEGCYVGGLVGFLSCSSIYNCANFEGSIKATANASVGGLFGYVNSVSSIDKCFNQAYVESNDGPTGGIIGKLGSSNVKINNCYNNADLKCNGSDGKSGYVIGGIVGQSESGLEFNRCYSYGKLERNLKVELTENSSYANKQLGKYITDNTSDPASSSWNISYLDSFDIQNNGGDSGGGGGSDPQPQPEPEPPKNYVSVSINKMEMRTASVVTSNLCGNSATYNNSICVDKKNSENFYNSVTLLRVYFDFYYNNTRHNAGRLDIKGNGSYRYTNSAGTTGSWSDDWLFYESKTQYVTFDYSSKYQLSSRDDDLMTKLDNYDWATTSADEFKGIYKGGYIAGIEFFMDGINYTDYITISLNVKYKIKISNNYDAERSIGLGQDIDLNKCGPKLTNNDSLKFGNSTSDISLSTLGDAYANVTNVNGGLPILKDFYWGY